MLSFGYWTTNFAEVQRALSAKSLSAARRTPLIGAYPKIFIPAITIIPGLVALATIPGLGGKDPNLQFNNAIPLLMNEYLPNGMLGIALAGLLAAFMAGVAANVSAFNTVVTYDLWEPYVRSGESDAYYLRFGRIATVTGIVIGIGTALIASGYTNIMDYIQTLFSFFNAPLFATFIIGMYWKRMTPWAGFWGLVAGTAGAAATYYLNKGDVIDLGSDQAAAFWGACVAFGADAIVSVVVSLFTEPKPIEELQGLVHGMANEADALSKEEQAWYRQPWVLAVGALGLTVLVSLCSSRRPNMAEDPHIQQSEQAEIDAERAAKAARLFDIRRLIGGLFLIYGVILAVLGLGESDASIAKSADININLYAGIGMLIMSACFIAWALWRPLGEPRSEELRVAGRRVRGRRGRRRRVAGSGGVAAPARRRRSRRPSCARRPRRRA